MHSRNINFPAASKDKIPEQGTKIIRILRPRASLNVKREITRHHLLGEGADKKRLIYHKVGLTDISLYTSLLRLVCTLKKEIPLRQYTCVVIGAVHHGGGERFFLIITTALDCPASNFEGE